MHWLHEWLAAYGLWAMALLLLGENAGLPFPGEAALLYASFLSRRGRLPPLAELITVAVLACVLGDNIGYGVGRFAEDRARRWFHLSDRRLARARKFFARWGASTIFFARFIAGLRIVAGPAAGVCRMEWRRFYLFNALGALAWVATVASAGYWLGEPARRLIASARGVSWALLAVAVLAAAWAGLRLRREAAARAAPKAASSPRTPQGWER